MRSLAISFSSINRIYYTNMHKTLAIIATILGIGFLALAFVYWLTPANALPAYLPGYDALLQTIHFKHGLGCFILALVFFVFAWFASADKKALPQGGAKKDLEGKA